MLQFLKKHRLRIAILSTCLILVATLMSVILFSGSIKVELDNGKLSLNAYYLSNKPFATRIISDLSDYSLGMTTEFDDGEIISGTSYTKIKAGRFHNDFLNDYMLFRYSSVKSVIVLIHKNDGISVAFNLKSQEQTEKFYSLLKEKM